MPRVSRVTSTGDIVHVDESTDEVRALREVMKSAEALLRVLKTAPFGHQPAIRALRASVSAAKKVISI